MKRPSIKEEDKDMVVRLKYAIFLARHFDQLATFHIDGREFLTWTKDKQIFFKEAEEGDTFSTTFDILGTNLEPPTRTLRTIILRARIILTNQKLAV
ncbi:hypothetical protein EOK75_17290 (plasmid) [Pseudorhodobacter turbinis]|uniref:Uncharacterized protein n=1 Tax=Pseudorhodobacter turbinis TaxID=2500533 RepID=A0A4P8EKC3_9RHOB|nr:hypothetical protein [Pseudorhodobacter turbinis]QCO57468.1 hypothetical protein EOK75_17290 [Pseudorhodobacter turbinis]